MIAVLKFRTNVRPGFAVGFSMRWFITIVVSAMLTAGCSGMTTSLGYTDDYYRNPYYDYYDPYYRDPFIYDVCPRYFQPRPINCSVCHFVY